MYEAVYVALLIGFPLAGALVRRWKVVLLPLVGWPLFGLGLDQGWWGDGTGDGWQVGLALVTVFGVCTTAVATLVGILVSLHRLKMRQPTTS